MRRRNFLLASGSTILTGSSTGILNKPSIGVEFDISGTPTENPSNVRSIFISFDTLSIEPRYIDTKESARVEVLLEVDNYGVDTQESFITLHNGREKDISSEFDPLVVDGINADNQSYISGTVSVEIDHPSIKDTYDRRFNINDNLIPSSALTQDLVAWYRFEDGDTRDSASNNRFPSVNWGDSTEYKGTILGATHSNSIGISDFENGVGKGGFEFDGQSDYIYNENVPAFQDSERTIMAWCYISSKDSVSNVVSLGSGLNDNERWSILLEDQTLNVGLIGQVNDYKFFDAGLTLDTWAHIAFTYDGAGLCRMYKDGVEFNSSSTTSFDTVKGMAVGTVASNDTREFFDGRIDDVRIYNKELSDSEVVDIYNETKPF